MAPAPDGTISKNSDGMVGTQDHRRQSTQLRDLPREFRDLIYGAALIHSQGYVQLFSRFHNDAKIIKLCLCVNLLQTCRQVHDEAAPILYGQDVFGILQPFQNARDPSTQILHMVGASYRGMIREVELCLRLFCDPHEPCVLAHAYDVSIFRLHPQRQPLRLADLLPGLTTMIVRAGIANIFGGKPDVPGSDIQERSYYTRALQSLPRAVTMKYALLPWMDLSVSYPSCSSVWHARCPMAGSRGH